MRRTKIVCTLGPATTAVDTLESLLMAGMDVARFNLSHGRWEEHLPRLRNLREAMARTGREIGWLLDTRGPEIRIGRLQGGQVMLQEGRRFVLTTQEVVGDEEKAHVQYPALPEDVRPGDRILLDDGKVVLEVEESSPTEVCCRVVVPGVLLERKKVSLPGVAIRLPVLSEEDVRDLQLAAKEGMDFVAVSFVRSPDDVLEVRRLLEQVGSSAQVIAKVESSAGVERLAEILKVSDGLMVARGDLGVEFPTEEVPLLQKEMIGHAGRVGKPVITATQMLESMVERPRPTRAEATDVANAIFDGTDAVMLSAETAVGKYPVEAVRVMARIAERTERALEWGELLQRRGLAEPTTVTGAISYATCTTARDLRAAAIITATRSGYTARMVARFRPQAPVVAVTPDRTVARQLCLVWGVRPLVAPSRASIDETIDEAIQCALQAGAIKQGDLVVITAGVPVGVPGTTNMLKVHTVGDILLKGTGIGTRSASGRVCVVRTVQDARRKFRPGDIMVVPASHRDLIPWIEKAGALIAEEGGMTSHAAVVALSLGLPAVVGAEGATGLLADGDVVTVDAERGLVYKGEARVL